MTPFEEGRRVYLSRCTACHNADPKLLGSIGPEVFGSSRELLEARVIHGTYPAGYKPKKPSAMMPAMPDLKDKIDALTAYLNDSR